MHLCLSGPKVEKTLKDNQVSIEAGYITEKNAAIQFTVGYEIPHPQSIERIHRADNFIRVDHRGRIL